MNVRIAGMGWVTPLGADLDLVWERLMCGEVGEIKTLTNPESGRILDSMPVPPKLVESLGRQPRLRRSSPISYFAVAAGLAAIENAGLQITPEMAARTAIIFAVSDGGVQYTRRFFDQIVKQGANSASPLLFPETVYNAPASHLAAQLGLDGASYTLVGDGTVGISALHFAGQLLATTDLDQCVVVGVEECDWVLCEAYRAWRFARTPLAEGAGALVLSRSGNLALETHPGVSFFRQSEAANALQRVCSELETHGIPDLVVRSANGTFIDRAEDRVLRNHLPALFPKRSFGEAPGASALLQTIAAALAVGKGTAQRALVSVIGFNQQASGAVISR